MVIVGIFGPTAQYIHNPHNHAEIRIQKAFMHVYAFLETLHKQNICIQKEVYTVDRKTQQQYKGGSVHRFCIILHLHESE